MSPANIGPNRFHHIEEAAGEVVAPPPVNAPRQTKAELVLGMLRREEAATIAELIEATGWLPHTTRAALTSLRKKGHVVEKCKRDAATCYRVAA
jgi:threonine dehydrogenase-like Zn-dependent dehydrogenase